MTTLKLRKHLFTTENRDTRYEDFEYEAKITMRDMDLEFDMHREYNGDMVTFYLKNFENERFEQDKDVTEEQAIEFERSWWINRIYAMSLAEQTKAVIENRGVLSQEAARVLAPEAVKQHPGIAKMLPARYDASDVLPYAMTFDEAEQAYQCLVYGDYSMPDDFVIQLFGADYPRSIIEPLSEEALEIAAKIGPSPFETLFKENPQLTAQSRLLLTTKFPGGKTPRINFETGEPVFDENGEVVFDVSDDWYRYDSMNFLDDGETINPFAEIDGVTFSKSGARMYFPEDVIASTCDEGLFIPYDVLATCLDLESLVVLMLSYGAQEDIENFKKKFNIDRHHFKYITDNRRLMIWDHDDVDDPEAISKTINGIAPYWAMRRKLVQKRRLAVSAEKKRDVYAVSDFVAEYAEKGYFEPKDDTQPARLFVPVLEYLYHNELDRRGYDEDDEARLSRKAFVPQIRNEIEKFGFFELDDEKKRRAKMAFKDIKNFNYPYDIEDKAVWEGIKKSRGNPQFFFTNTIDE